MRAWRFLGCWSAVLLISGCMRIGWRQLCHPRRQLLRRWWWAEAVREAAPNDYLRIVFPPPGVKVTSIAKPGALHGFATATPLYYPPLKLEDFPYYSGLAYNDTNTLVAMR